MAGCGYVCPVCEGSGFDNITLEDCSYCGKKSTNVEITDEEWIDKVHNSNCCSDIASIDLKNNTP